MADESIVDPGTGNTEGAGGTKTWHEGLPEDLRANEAFKGFTDLGGLAKAYLGAQDTLSKAPKAPEKPDMYELQTPEGDEALKASFAETAHKNGLSNDQAKALWGTLQGEATRLSQARQSEEAQSLAKLKTEWSGKAWDENVALAQKAEVMLKRDQPEVIEAAKKYGLGNQAWFVKFLAFMGKGIAEDGGSILFGQSGKKDTGSQRTIGGTPMLRFPSMEK